MVFRISVLIFVQTLKLELVLFPGYISKKKKNPFSFGGGVFPFAQWK